MRNPVENAHLLQKKINDLQLENQILKNILDRACVSYTHEFARISKPEDVEEYDPDQGGWIVHPMQIMDEMANLFYAGFWSGRMSMRREAGRKGLGKRDIIRNVVIAGRISVLKCAMRK